MDSSDSTRHPVARLNSDAVWGRDGSTIYFPALGGLDLAYAHLRSAITEMVGSSKANAA
jgi:hypothetical protein